MISFILFVLLLVVGWYGYNTRERLRNVASLVDQVHVNIDRAFAEDRVRLEKLEQSHQAKSRKQ